MNWELSWQQTRFFSPGWKRHGINLIWGSFSFVFPTTPHIGSDLSLLRQVWLLGYSPGATEQPGICSPGSVAIQTWTVVFIWHQHVVDALKPRTSLVLLQQSSPDSTDYNPHPIVQTWDAILSRAKNGILWRACNAFIRLWSWWLRPWSACWPYL